MNRWTAPVVGFLVPFVVLGAFYWSLEYSQVELPTSLTPFGLLVLGLGAMALRGATNTPFWAAWLFPAASVPAVVIVRIVVDTSADPTSHNLWPFEVVLAAMVGGTVAAVGFAVGELFRRALRPRATTRPTQGPPLGDVSGLSG